MSEENKDQQATETTQTAAETTIEQDQATEIPANDDIRSDTPKPEKLYDFDEPGDDEIPSGEDTTKGGDVPTDKGKEAADAPNFGDELLARGEKLGLSKEEIADFGTPEMAAKALTLLEKRSQGAPAQPAEADKATQTAKPTGFEKFKVALDPDVYDPAIIETINGINDHYAKQFETMQGQLSQAHESLSRQQALQFEQQFEGWIGELSDGYKDVLGEGSGADMDKNSEPFKNRVKVLDEMETIAAGCSRMGKQVPPYGELFEKALASVFKNKQGEIARKEISSKLSKRQIIARPSQRRGGNVDPEATARSYVKQFLEERDMSEPSTAMDF
jgi:hypothetical protein